VTVAATARKAGPFAGDGATVNFDFAFKIFAATDVVVTFTSAAGVDTVKTITTDYTVLMNADQDVSPGGRVTMLVAPAGGGTPEKITLSSAVPESQGTVLPNGGQWNAKVVERALDKVTVLVGQVREVLSRTLRQPISDTTVIGDLPTATIRRGKFLAFEDSAAAQPMASAGPGTTPVSSAMSPVVSAATLAAGRTAFGVAASGANADITSLAAPALGAATATTAAAADSSTKVATTAFVAAAGNAAFPRSYLAGLALANNAGDPTNDIDIAVGDARDSGNAANITLGGGGLTKQLDAVWAVGSAAGMRASGAAIANTTYHIFIIRRPDTGVVDIAADTSATGANIAANTNANYTQIRRIGSIVRSAGAILAFIQDGDKFVWKTGPVADVAATNPGAAAVTRTLTVPVGLRVEAIVDLNVFSSSANVTAFRVSDLSTDDVAVTGNTAQVGGTYFGGANPAFGSAQARVFTNTSAQIRSRASLSDANTLYSIGTEGWIDRRGRDV
jgi:hypothetical protein